MDSKYSFNFKDKVVAITGAGGVICGELAVQFAKQGAKVALLNRSEDSAMKYANQIKQMGKTAKVYVVDVLDKNRLIEVRDEIEKDFSLVDVLINGAGGNNPKATTDNEFHQADLKDSVKTFFDLDKDGIEFVFNLNYLGTLLPTQVFAEKMIGKEGANIVNISSMNAFVPLTKIPAYSGAKAAVSNLTQWLAVYFSKVGIRCNAIAPGFLISKQNETLLFDKDGNPTARANKILTNTPMERFGKKEELVGGVFYLADSNLSGFVTGVVLPIDGGFAAYSGV